MEIVLGLHYIKLLNVLLSAIRNWTTHRRRPMAAPPRPRLSRNLVNHLLLTLHLFPTVVAAFINMNLTALVFRVDFGLLSN